MKNLEILRKNEEYKGRTNDEKNLKAILERAYDRWNPILRHTFEKNLGITPGKLEESGKILGKDLWVRAH